TTAPTYRLEEASESPFDDVNYTGKGTSHKRVKRPLRWRRSFRSIEQLLRRRLRHRLACRACLPGRWLRKNDVHGKQHRHGNRYVVARFRGDHEREIDRSGEPARTGWLAPFESE